MTLAPLDPTTGPPGSCPTTGPPPRRVCLRPGVRVVRRDPATLQVGLDHLALVVPRRPGDERVLDELARGAPVDRLRVPPLLLSALIGRDLLVDAGVLAELSPAATAGRDASQDAVRAAFAAHGSRAPARLGARRAASVEVRGPDDWAESASVLLARAGISTRSSRARRPTTQPLLLLSAGEPRRADLDHVVRGGRPHLVVSSVQGRVRVGPFVVPGVTACLRCVDAHAGERDPRRSLVLEQQADGVPDPVDPVLGDLAVALAVRDLVAWSEGERPTTWSATLTVDAGAELVPRRWGVHPCCGCGWGESLPVP